MGDLPATRGGAPAPGVDVGTPGCALAIGAHPDDIEFGCGSTLAKWAADGCRVHHLVLTDGSKGSWDPDADLERLVRERAEECRAAAAVIDGASPEAATSGRAADRVTFLGAVDGELVDGPVERREVARAIRTFRPDVVLAHDPWRRYRLHPDHRAAGFLSIGALVGARDPHFFRDLGLAPHRPQALLLWEADEPNHLEDARGFETVKIEALLCHRSQAVTTMGFGSGSEPAGAVATAGGDVERFVARIRRQLASHGAIGGLDTAEAFHLMEL